MTKSYELEGENGNIGEGEHHPNNQDDAKHGELDIVKNFETPAEDTSMAERQTKKVKYPKQVFFIVGNEACERFSYYGMRTVLTLYLNEVLKYSEDSSTIIFHVFVLLCYFFPIFGGIIADSWLGKYRTVAYISVIYALGNIVLSISAVTSWNLPSAPLAFIGLLLIAVGTGGIKPCVSSFGGDQFVLPDQERQLAAFFSVFYFSINAGSLLSTFLTPELRTVACLGYDTCYPLAFSVPAVLMVVSLVLFVLGRPMYKIKEPEGNVTVDVVKCMWSACVNKIRSKQKRDHWLDHADKRFSEKLREDIRITLRSFLLFVPLPVFWALYEQQGSRWTFQANNLNGRIGSFVVKPDQMQLINPLLILALLPLSDRIIYPLFAKCNMLKRPLQKMATGGMIGAIAFIISGILEIQIEKGPGYAVELEKGYGQVHLVSALPCNVTISGPDVGETAFILKSLSSWNNYYIDTDGTSNVSLTVDGTCAKGTISLKAYEQKSYTYQLYAESNVASVAGNCDADDLTKNVNPSKRVIYHFDDTSSHKMTLTSDSKTVTRTLTGTGCELLDTSSDTTTPGWFSLALDGTVVEDNVLLDVGGVFTLVLDNKLGYIESTVGGNTINLFWLLPQYIVITVAEILLSVTGYEFSFTQAPISMKSLVSAVYLLTDAIGNLIVILVAEVKFLPTQADEFFLFAGLMVASMILFIFFAMRYKYVTLVDEDDFPLQDGSTTTLEKKEELEKTRF